MTLESTPREVKVYQRADGKRPFRDWYLQLTTPFRLRVTRRINHVMAGTFGDIKPVGDGVSELRIDFGQGLRVYYGQDGPSVVLLLAGGDKTTQERDIRRAKEYWEDYKKRKRADEWTLPAE